MKLGVSNLVLQEDTDLDILVRNDIKYVEIVLPMHITWGSRDLKTLHSFIQTLADKGISVKSTQAIMYNSGITSLNSDTFTNHIDEVSSVCEKVGVQKIILGAPTCRVGSSTSVGFLNNFKYIDTILGYRNQQLLIEPNSKIYGGEYFFTVGEIVRFVNANRYENIKTMLDVHNMVVEDDNPSTTYVENIDNIEHVHVSELGLGDYRQSEVHNTLATTLRTHNYQGLIVYEAKPSENLKTSIELFSKTYRI